MPYRNLLNSFGVILISALVGYATTKYIQKKNSPSRYMASMTMGKMASEQFSKTVFDIKVKNVEIGKTESDLSTVQVSIEAFKEIPAGLSFNWNIPNDVTVVEGSQHGLLQKFTANEIQNLELKIKGYNKIKKSFISFSIEGFLGSAKLNREVLLSSRPEDSFEYIVQNYERAKEAEAQVNSKMGQATHKPLIDIKKVIH